MLEATCKVKMPDGTIVPACDGHHRHGSKWQNVLVYVHGTWLNCDYWTAEEYDEAVENDTPLIKND